MSSNAESAADPNVQSLRESFGRVVYSHKTHEKAREIACANVSRVKWINIILTALTSTSLVTTIFTNQKVLLYISSVLSTAVLAFVIFQLSFDPAGDAERHRSSAQALWYIRERYIHLLADIKTDPTNVAVRQRRDELTDELKKIYDLAPDTSSKAYKAAQKALKVSEDMTFTNDEINAFLPETLHV